jgi:hypothetical protein
VTGYGELVDELARLEADLQVAQGVLERQRREVAFLTQTVAGMLERVAELRAEVAGDRVYVRSLDKRVRTFMERHTGG